MIHVLLHNIRSTHNVGSILRTCDGFGIDTVIFSGYTPYPETSTDNRLPHIARKLTQAIHKTALGAEININIITREDPLDLIAKYKSDKWLIAGLEQNHASVSLAEYRMANDNILLILGEEVHGITNELLARCDIFLEIPMVGKKESFNVSVAAGVCLYHLRLIAGKL